MTAKDPCRWLAGRTPIGFQSNSVLANYQRTIAKKMKQELIDRYITLGDMCEANRLTQESSRGYPGNENMNVLAQMHGITIEFHTLSYDGFPVERYGHGPLVRVGHMVLVDGAGGRADHFVCLRTEADYSNVHYSVKDVLSEVVIRGNQTEKLAAHKDSLRKHFNETLNSFDVPFVAREDPQRPASQEVFKIATPQTMVTLPCETIASATRKAHQWFRHWSPTTLLGRTIDIIAHVAVTFKIPVEQLVLVTPPDGYCLMYSLMTAKDPCRWLADRTPIGFQSNSILENYQHTVAKNMKQDLINRYIALDDMSSSRGYPDNEHMNVLAQMHGITIEFHTLSYEGLPVERYGHGPVCDSVIWSSLTTLAEEQIISSV